MQESFKQLLALEKNPTVRCESLCALYVLECLKNEGEWTVFFVCHNGMVKFLEDNMFCSESVYNKKLSHVKPWWQSKLLEWQIGTTEPLGIKQTFHTQHTALRNPRNQASGKEVACIQILIININKQKVCSLHYAEPGRNHYSSACLLSLF